MKKKDLLAMPALEATDAMIRLAKNDRGRLRKTYSWDKRRIKVFRSIYSRAVVEGTVLKAVFFCREDLTAGNCLPRYEVYISLDEDNDMTYLPQKQKWSEARIDSLPVEDGYKCFSNDYMEEWEEPGARDTVNAVLFGGESRCSVFNEVSTWQQLRRARKLRGRHQREKERIDIAMNQVPELPKDWTKWVYDSAYCHAQYMMYHYGDKENRAWCTACGSDVKLKKRVKHQEYVKCPHCRKKVLALSWNHQKTIQDTKKPAILQERKDGGYVLRVFESRIKRRKEGNWKVHTIESYIHEKYRIFLDRDFRQETIYEYTLWKNKYENETRWCYGGNGVYGYGYYCIHPDECILYYRNLKKLRKGTVLRYMPIEMMFRKNEGCYGNAVRQLHRFRELPQLEYLIKMGLYRLAWDLTKNGNCSGLLDTEKRNPLQALGLDRQQIEMAVKMNASKSQVLTMKAAAELGIRLTRQQTEWYTRELGHELTQKTLEYGHPVKMMNYMIKLKEQGCRVGDYLDYLEDIRILALGRTEDVLFPKNFQAAHERLSDQRREKEERVRMEKIHKKDLMLQAMLPDLEKVYTGTEAEDDFVMVLPTCKEDFNREGRENHNCVGGAYFDRMVAGETVVLFLRKRKEADKAFCTVEMNDSRIIQCRAIRNSSPPDEVKDFMAKYAKEVASRIRKKEAAARILIPAI